jgi:hypothetical protein
MRLKQSFTLSALLGEIAEDGNEEIFPKIQEELATAKTPVRQLLHSFLASRYYHIYEEKQVGSL